MECVSENDVVCEDVQTPSVSSAEDSEERKEVSGGPGEKLEEDEDVQCSDGGSGCDGDDVDDKCVGENEIGEEVSQEVREGAGDECDEEIGEELGEDGSVERLEDGEEVQCQDCLLYTSYHLRLFTYVKNALFFFLSRIRRVD